MSEGLRPIVVEGLALRWSFDGRLVVVPAERSGPALYVDWGYVDRYLDPEGPEPRIVTPSFVAEAVRFGLAQGWNPDVNGRPTRMSYREGEGFRLA